MHLWATCFKFRASLALPLWGQRFQHIWAGPVHSESRPSPRALGLSWHLDDAPRKWGHGNFDRENYDRPIWVQNFEPSHFSSNELFSSHDRSEFSKASVFPLQSYEGIDDCWACGYAKTRCLWDGLFGAGWSDCVAIRKRKMNLDASAPMYMYLFLRDVGLDSSHQLKTLIFKLQFQWKQ